MPKIEFSVYGEPVAKGRPKFSVRGGFARAYTPKKTQISESNFRTQAMPYKPDSLIDTPINIGIKIYKAIPKSKSKRFKTDAENGEELPKSRPDLDNYIKTVFDALNGVFWTDDSLICGLTAQKFYGNTPRIDVEINY
jgi:Holliday junction resolvase RusA-like endonuclease